MIIKCIFVFHFLKNSKIKIKKLKMNRLSNDTEKISN